MSSKFKRKLLTVFGDIKLLKWPLFMYYSPGDYYKASGEASRNAMRYIEPGDIICRGYDSYLDGYFIPGEFSHSGICLDNHLMVHAVAEGVSSIDVLDFLRCDRFVVLRPVSGQKEAMETAKALIGKPYDFDFKPDNDAFYCHEFTAYCYSMLHIQKVTPYLGFIRFCGMEPTYLAESFLESTDFKTICVGGNTKLIVD